MWWIFSREFPHQWFIYNNTVNISRVQTYNKGNYTPVAQKDLKDMIPSVELKIKWGNAKFHFMYF